MTKQHILNEIKRTAEENAGKPLGIVRFETETGIKDSDWFGIYWTRFSDAQREAGYTPNQMAAAYEDDWLFERLIDLARKLNRFPGIGDRMMQRRDDGAFPGPTAFRRFGSKSELISKVAEYCRTRPGYEDVLPFCIVTSKAKQLPNEEDSGAVDETGFVYLLKSGRFYKIGRTNASGRRGYELAIQLPEKAKVLHQIRTDDPVGIEAYWHKRFESQRKNGEWFELAASHVKAFRRRKFM